MREDLKSRRAISGGLPGSKLRAFETAPSAPVMRDLHWRAERGESKRLFRQRNKKLVAARTHNSGNALLWKRRFTPAGFSLAPDQRAPVFSNRGKCH
jgi:hypothetical protein